MYVTHFRPRIKEAIHKPTFSAELGETAVEIEVQWKTECVIQSLASLFIASPSKLGAFSQLVPEAFTTFLKLGSEQRKRLNAILLKEDAFDERFEYLIANTDDLVAKPFFWNDQVWLTSCVAQDHHFSHATA